ncbi:bifunctional oligoribonuclease/PAP phosphatase NrnA [Anaerolentibacter hominis]|uniref:DHH family phosphoesterase n=1 Tax=Anaerolentibacter hominis TaxID=3079009 RepID=UPI0031B88BD9
MNLIEILKDCKTIGIGGHVRPDGDCVGSCLGLYHYLHKKLPGADITVYLEFVPEAVKLLAGSDSIVSGYEPGKKHDAFVALDCGDLARLGFSGPYFQEAGVTVMVDHHISNQNSSFGQHALVDPRASATCEILFDLMEPDGIDKTVAECLYLGIVHDTNSFKNSNTTEHTMQVAGALIGHGINFTKIIDDSFYMKTYVQNQILGRCLLESLLALNGKVILSVLNKRVLDFYQASSQDVDGIIQQLNVTEGVEVAILVYELEQDVFKVSLRSHDIVDVSRIATAFGGGGHVRAAGFTFRGDSRDVINNLMLYISNQLQEHSDDI